MLPRARIPIIKLNMPPTATIPEGMACDIGFENRLALENTRLLLTYAMVDPRLRTLVLFRKIVRLFPSFLRLTNETGVSTYSKSLDKEKKDQQSI